MDTTFNNLLFRTAFCCMACDGEIALEEVELIKSICKETPTLQYIDFEMEINRLITEINTNGKQFLANFLKTIEQKVPDLTEQEEFDLIDIAIKVIKADGKIEYSEVKFFKAIRYCFKVSDDSIISHFSDFVEDIDLFLGEDIQTASTLIDITQQYFEIIELPQFEFVNNNANDNPSQTYRTDSL